MCEVMAFHVVTVLAQAVGQFPRDAIMTGGHARGHDGDPASGDHRAAS
jgi:hypothetical protein